MPILKGIQVKSKYGSSSSSMRPFRNTGWKLYKKMLKMSPGTAAKGTHLYSPLTSTSVCSHPNIIESSTDPFMSTFSNVSTGIPDFPIDIDHPDSLDVTTGGSTDNLSTTLRKASADEGHDRTYLNINTSSFVMGPPLAPPLAPPLFHPASSATSQTDSGNPGSSKRRKTKTLKDTEVAALMRSSHEQASTSSQQTSIGHAQVQQLDSGAAGMTSMLRQNMQMIGRDPLTDTYREAGRLISTGPFDFSVQEKIDLQDCHHHLKDQIVLPHRVGDLLVAFICNVNIVVFCCIHCLGRCTMIWIVRATILVPSIKVAVRPLHLVDRLILHDEIMQSGQGHWNSTLDFEWSHSPIWLGGIECREKGSISKDSSGSQHRQGSTDLVAPRIHIES
ncbi:hypothetical protein FIBSPDRAFT_894966 [Athelia psychrophila]|uniref:Uncharacterized protein n=1 Tax=Athelia psychrophila TaxID=1759441 RepID=A0A166F853_9AGAM|nr:hypothetical protein FIBSPDRAFT_894966 [Fibularhizoctonia sp. CBS 109695]